MRSGTHLNIGILAHVDAGKTTLAESILFLNGSIKKAGRVDHGDAFLDTYAQERERGITIFSKQAEVMFGEQAVTLLDTPGHVDFSAEMERTLQVLDYAILVISGADGVQGHVITLWRLLEQYQIPVFLFINKMDQNGTDRHQLMKELKTRLNEHCVDFCEPEELLLDELAMCDEKAMEEFLDTDRLEKKTIGGLILARKVFPCYFGSALKMTGVDTFLEGISGYAVLPEYPDEFGARVYKIARDNQGNRLTYLKVTGGVLKVKQLIRGCACTGDGTSDDWEEKADQIRIYSGAGYQTVNEAPAGTVCAVTGLTRTFSGEGLGLETGITQTILEPVLTYELILPEGCDCHMTFRKLRQLEEEIPELHLVWKEETQEISAQLMGEVQIEILKNLVKERFGIEVAFGTGTIVYKETIAQPAEGVGHFEPLRHYAEVHLILEPGEPGSGLQFETICSTDELDLNWQRLILTHLEERKHPGVLTGSEITDMKITLAAGKAHLKHTEGGDFRQATYRAVRQGLKKTVSVLLEPVYDYRLEVPSEMIGRAMADIQRMQGTFSVPEQEGELSVLKGTVPVASMGNYQAEVTAYSKGMGRLFCTLKGYEPCHNTEEVIAQTGYDSERDTANPTGSVFCAHGAGFYVPWDQVEAYMHLDYVFEQKRESREEIPEPAARMRGYGADIQDDAELLEIFQRTFGSIRQERTGWSKSRTRSFGNETGRSSGRKQEAKARYLLVDGYNIIFSWDDLNELAKTNMAGARGRLMDILCNYQGYRSMQVILVFDAYQVEGGVGSIEKYHNIFVVYTKEAETADQYIEKTVHEIGRQYEVTVATSDAAEQVIIWAEGASRMSADGLRKEIQETCKEMQSLFLQKNPGGKQYLFENLSDDLAGFLEEVRLGIRKFEDKAP